MPLNQTMYTADQVRALIAGMQPGSPEVGTRTKDVQSLYGVDGLFSTPGLNPYLISAIMKPETGLRGLLPWRPALYEQDILGVLTGVTASSGANPTEACVPGPTPGKLKICQRFLPFGQIKMSTELMSLTKMGRTLDRCTMVEPRIMNNPFTAMDQVANGGQGDNWLRDEIKLQIAMLFFAMDRDYKILDKTGDPANTAGNDDDSYVEYYGTDYQINDGYRDAKSGRLCPAVDSYLWDMGGLSINDNGAAYVNTLRRAMAYAEYLAQMTGLAPVTFGIRGTLGAYMELAEVWWCGVGTSGCTTSESGQRIVIDGMDQVRAREDMLNGIFNGREVGPYLPINGRPYPFIIEDTMGETNVGNVYTGELEIIPLASPKFVHPENPGGAITFYEYFKWDGPRAGVEALRQLGSLGRLGMPMVEIMRNGRTMVYSLANEDVCIRIGAVERYRLVIAAPFLAQRLMNVTWEQQTPTRDSIPGMPNFYNGGGYNFDGYTQALYSPRDS